VTLLLGACILAQSEAFQGCHVVLPTDGLQLPAKLVSPPVRPLPTLKPTYPGTNTHTDIGSANVSFGTYNTLLNFSVFLLFFLFLVLRE